MGEKSSNSVSRPPLILHFNHPEVNNIGHRSSQCRSSFDSAHARLCADAEAEVTSSRSLVSRDKRSSNGDSQSWVILYILKPVINVINTDNVERDQPSRDVYFTE